MSSDLLSVGNRNETFPSLILICSDTDPFRTLPHEIIYSIFITLIFSEFADYRELVNNKRENEPTEKFIFPTALKLSLVCQCFRNILAQVPYADLIKKIQEEGYIISFKQIETLKKRCYDNSPYSESIVEKILGNIRNLSIPQTRLSQVDPSRLYDNINILEIDIQSSNCRVVEKWLEQNLLKFKNLDELKLTACGNLSEKLMPILSTVKRFSLIDGKLSLNAFMQLNPYDSLSFIGMITDNVTSFNNLPEVTLKHLELAITVKDLDMSFIERKFRNTVNLRSLSLSIFYQHHSLDMRDFPYLLQSAYLTQLSFFNITANNDEIKKNDKITRLNIGLYNFFNGFKFSENGEVTNKRKLCSSFPSLKILNIQTTWQSSPEGFSTWKLKDKLKLALIFRSFSDKESNLVRMSFKRSKVHLTAQQTLLSLGLYDEQVNVDTEEFLDLYKISKEGTLIKNNKIFHLYPNLKILNIKPLRSYTPENILKLGKENILKLEKILRNLPEEKAKLVRIHFNNIKGYLTVDQACAEILIHQSGQPKNLDSFEFF